MADKTSGGLIRYQGRGSNTRRVFVRNYGNSYGRGWGQCHWFNSTKPKVQGNFEALGIDIYSIGNTRQAYKYIKTIEAKLNHIQVSLNREKDVK